VGSLAVIPGLQIEDLKKFIEDFEHEYSTAHKRLCFIIIKRIYRRVLNGHRFGGIKVDSTGLVVDGNHRYIAYKLAKIEFEIIPWTSSLSDEPKSYNKITIDEIEDWDLNCLKNMKYCTDDFLTEEKSAN